MSELSLLIIGAHNRDLLEFSERNPFAISELQELRMAVLPGTKYGGYAAMGNKWKREALGNVIGMVHADTIFKPGALTIFAKAALEGAVTGMVGVSLGPPKVYVWGCHVKHATPVSTLDSCSVFLRKDAPIQFDEKTFDGFHCAVEDLCLSAQAAGIPVRVPPANANHEAKRTFGVQWQAEYRDYRARLDKKWDHCKFGTT